MRGELVRRKVNLTTFAAQRLHRNAIRGGLIFADNQGIARTACVGQFSLLSARLRYSDAAWPRNRCAAGKHRAKNIPALAKSRKVFIVCRH